MKMHQHRVEQWNSETSKTKEKYQILQLQKTKIVFWKYISKTEATG